MSEILTDKLWPGLRRKRERWGGGEAGGRPRGVKKGGG